MSQIADALSLAHTTSYLASRLPMTPAACTGLVAAVAVPSVRPPPRAVPAARLDRDRPADAAAERARVPYLPAQGASEFTKS